MNFAAGDLALLVDSKNRRYLVTLKSQGEFHLHSGVVHHDELIGSGPGLTIRSSGGSRLVAVRPTLGDYVLKMPRGAQVIYPKDLGPILMLADLAPGMRVLEAGLGSGAMSLAALRAIGSEGTLVSYELRDDHAARAIRNIEAFLGAIPGNHLIRIGDVADGVEDETFDRVILDLPEPWRALPVVVPALMPGGIVVCYLPTVPQVSETVEAMRDVNLGMTEVIEVINRSWHVEGLSVRPDHRMVGHTGFLVRGRLLGADAGHNSNSQLGER